MKKEELIKIALELGVPDAETLTVAQLNKAIAAAQVLLDASKALKLKAEEFGVITEGKTDKEISEAVEEAEALAREINSQARQTEVLAVLSEYLGVGNIDSLSKEEVQDLLNKKATAGTLDKPEAPKKVEGKSSASFTASNGKEYAFKSDAPAAFQYLGQFRTQKQWLSDKDSLELMVAGNLSFITLKK